MDERVIEWNEGRKMAIELFNGQKIPPWKNAVAEFSVREHDGGTIVQGAFRYDMKFGPLGALMDRFMIRPQFGDAFGSLLAGLKHYVETGEEVTEAWEYRLTRSSPLPPSATGGRRLIPSAREVPIVNAQQCPVPVSKPTAVSGDKFV